MYLRSLLNKNSFKYIFQQIYILKNVAILYQCKRFSGCSFCSKEGLLDCGIGSLGSRYTTYKCLMATSLILLYVAQSVVVLAAPTYTNFLC